MDFFTTGIYLKGSVNNKARRPSWPADLLYIKWVDGLICVYAGGQEYPWLPLEPDMYGEDYETVNI
jgi:hypothetical protein